MIDITKIPYKQIQKFPDPLTKTPLDELSDKDKSRVIFALSYELERATFMANKIGQDFIMQNWPVDQQ